MISKVHTIALAFSVWCKLATTWYAGLSAFVKIHLNIMVSAMAAVGRFRVAVVFAIAIYSRVLMALNIVLSLFPVSAITLTKEMNKIFLFADTGSTPGVLVQMNIDNGLSKTSCLSLNCNC